MSAIAMVTSLNVSPAALRHRNVRAAHMVTRSMHDSRENVIGTANDKGPITQLYGWCNTVSLHADCTGWIYFMPLRLPRHGSMVYASYAGKEACANLKVGTVYCLDDYIPHGTYDMGPVVCLMRGPYKNKADGEAIVELYRGLEALATAAANAPSVKAGFHFPLKNECWVEDFDPNVVLRIANAREAERQGLHIAQCGKCQAHAFKLDHYFPMHSEQNRCFAHFMEEMRE